MPECCMKCPMKAGYGCGYMGIAMATKDMKSGRHPDCPLEEADDVWIPCEDRSPKESGLYLVTSTDIIDDYAVDTRFFNREKPFVGWSGYEWHEDPLAWMELPKPYIPEENEL